jgi:hypothetical protein
MLKRVAGFLFLIMLAWSANAAFFQGSTFKPASGGGTAAFTALHTFFMNPSGNDACNGTVATLGSSGNCAWLTPDHAGLVCGDVILAASGNYAPFSVNHNPGTCPSVSGGLTASPGGIYFVTVLCAGASVGDCTVNWTATGGIDPGIGIGGNNWAFEGWEGSGGYSLSAGGAPFVIDGTVAGAIRHHVAFINDICINNASCAFVQDNGIAGTNLGGDYWAMIGLLAQNSGGRCDGFFDAAIDIIGITNFDTVAGTHIIADGNFSYNVKQPVGCNATDGEAMMTDTLDFHNYTQKVVIRNSILAGATRYGMQMFFQNNFQNAVTINFYNNTLYGNNTTPANVVAACDNAAGEINIISSSGTMPWHINITNNLAQSILAQCPAAGPRPLYGLLVATTLGGTFDPNLVIGGTGTQNYIKGLATSCVGSFCDSGSTPISAITFDTINNLGTNIYASPNFNNPSDFVTNRYGVPNCSGFISTTACMGWVFATQTATNPSVIFDMTPTTAGAIGKGYQPPLTSCASSDPDYPTWLKGIVYLHWNGSSLTENSDLITKPCGM